MRAATSFTGGQCTDRPSRIWSNLQPGQTLGVNAILEHAPFARAIARQAYQAGARYVDVLYTDQHVRRAHVAGARDDDLGFSPPWLVERYRKLGETGGALCAISGNPEPEILADLDGARVARARMREVAEASLALTDGLCNWKIVAYPNEGWAQTVLREPNLEKLWDAVATAVRLEEPDPVEAWHEHVAALQQSAAVLNTHAFDALRYRGPGTDLSDDGAARLGEVALVDGHSRVGVTGLVFYDTLFDENASSHIAFGASILKAVPWAIPLSPEDRHERGVNQSTVHTDFMIGSGELEIDGLDAGRNATAILRNGDWMLS